MKVCSLSMLVMYLTKLICGCFIDSRDHILKVSVLKSPIEKLRANLTLWLENVAVAVLFLLKVCYSILVVCMLRQYNSGILKPTKVSKVMSLYE